MNWKTYLTLTSKQKEEYNFKFRDAKWTPNISTFGLTLSLLILTAALMTAMSYIILKDPNLIDYRDQVQNILKQTSQILRAGVWIIIGFMIVELGVIIYNFVKLRKFYKQHNIKFNTVFQEVHILNPKG